MGISRAELKAVIADLQMSIEVVRADIRKLKEALAILRAAGVKQSPAIKAIVKERKQFELGLNELLTAQRNLQNLAATEKSAEGSTVVN